MSAEAMNQAGFAAHRGVSRKTITGWKQRGLLVFHPNGSVDVAATDNALAGHGITLPSEREGNSFADTESDADELSRFWSKAHAERVRENYLALLRQLEYERGSAEVVLVEDAMMHIRNEFAIIRERLSAVSAEVVPQLAKLRSAEECKAVIDSAIHRALTELTE